jgi:hypothetical protein
MRIIRKRRGLKAAALQWIPEQKRDSVLHHKGSSPTLSSFYDFNLFNCGADRDKDEGRERI